jgi:hypothetical protein
VPAGVGTVGVTSTGGVLLPRNRARSRLQMEGEALIQ